MTAQLEWSWLEGALDDPAETRSLAAITVRLAGTPVTRIYDRLLESEREAINVPLYSLAVGLADNWWTLLHEPRKTASGDPSSGRHALDAFLSGYVFPSISIWSLGDEAVSLEYVNAESTNRNIAFLEAGATAVVPRGELEGCLFRLISSVVARTKREGELSAAWARVVHSMADPDERQYCEMAGRLGVNPYDREAPDLLELTHGLRTELISDICEAVRPAELPAAVSWVRQNSKKTSRSKIEMKTLQSISLPDRDLAKKPSSHGYMAARRLREELSMHNLQPRRVIDELFGELVKTQRSANGPFSHQLEALARTTDRFLAFVVPPTTARQRRSRLCRALYLSWVQQGQPTLATTATTARQQASRAFAADGASGLASGGGRPGRINA